MHRRTGRILVVGARVQGGDAVPELVRALRTVNLLAAEVCIVGRGGGDVDVPIEMKTDRITNAILKLDPSGHASVDWVEKKSKNK